MGNPDKEPAGAPVEAGEESAMPTPGKHQLRPTPLQIAQHQIEQQGKRTARHGEELARLSQTVEEQGKKIEAQSEQIASLTEKLEKTEAARAVLEGRLAAMTELLEKIASRPAQAAAPAMPPAPEGPIRRAVPVEPPPSAEASAEPAPAEGEFYVVKKGDNLTTIARQHGTTVAELLKLNKIDDERKLQIGQKLILPKASPAPATAGPGSSTPSPSKQNGHEQVVPDEVP